MDIFKSLSSSVPTDKDANAVKLESSLLGISGQLKSPHTVVARGRRSDENWISSGTSVLDREQSLDDASFCSTSPVCAAPIVRQFWKAGVYNDELTPKSTTQCMLRFYVVIYDFF